MATCSRLAPWVLIALSLLPGVDHLEPDRERLQDEYRIKLRTLFSDAYREGVSLQALVVPSFAKEFAVGVRPEGKSGDVEAFVLETASSVWDTELVKMYETGEIGSLGPDGKELPLDRNPAYLDLKKRTPSDYRKIKVSAKARQLPRDMAKRLRNLWDTMLRDVKPIEKDALGFDGTTYHISARFEGRGLVSGSTWSPDEDTPKTWQITRLVDALRDYARGAVDLGALAKVVEQAERVIGR